MGGGGQAITVEDASGISIVRREEGEEPTDFNIIPTGTAKVKGRGDEDIGSFRS